MGGLPKGGWFLEANLDLFERYGLDLPMDMRKSEKAVAVFRANGIVPIAISLSDIPHSMWRTFPRRSSGWWGARPQRIGRGNSERACRVQRISQFPGLHFAHGVNPSDLASCFVTCLGFFILLQVPVR